MPAIIYMFIITVKWLNIQKSQTFKTSDCTHIKSCERPAVTLVQLIKLGWAVLVLFTRQGQFTLPFFLLIIEGSELLLKYHLIVFIFRGS